MWHVRIVCEGATGFKMIPTKPTSRKKPQQPTLDLIGTLVLQQTTFKRLQKGTLMLLAVTNITVN